MVKRPGVLSKVQMLDLVLGVGSSPFFLILGPQESRDFAGEREIAAATAEKPSILVHSVANPFQPNMV